MKILMLVPCGDIRGPVPVFAPHLVAALRARGATVETHPWGRVSDDEGVLAKVGRRFEQVRSVYRATRAGDFDVAVVHTAHDWQTLPRDVAVAWAIRRRCSVVLHLHGSQSSSLQGSRRRPFKLMTKLLLTLVSGVLVLSTEEQEQWSAFRPGTPVFVMKNPYVRAAFPEVPPHIPPSLLFVGRLVADKGIFELVAAMPEVLEQARCVLTIVGTGRGEKELRRRIDELGLHRDVVLNGYLTGDALRREYASATLFVLPTWWNEGFPTVLSEAMDAGLPIVTTPVRGARDHLVAGRHAVFVEPRDVGGLARSLLALMSDPPLLRRMAAANRERVELFEPDAVAAEYLRALEAVLQEEARYPSAEVMGREGHDGGVPPPSGDLVPAAGARRGHSVAAVLEEGREEPAAER